MSYAHHITGGRIRLKDYDPGDHGGLKREEAQEKTAELGAEMGELHDLLFAAGQNALLIVLQGRDTSGKDGLIRHLLQYINAQSARVVPFKVPTAGELAHDFLWRIHCETPARGSIAIFNRSHYEDVLVVRVHNIVPEEVWRRRYDHINHFESLLRDANTILVKFYLHINKEEQEQRLLDREKDATKAWKLAVGDWKERELWDRYTEAYEEALSRCSPEHAPWYVVPANHKWFRDLAVTERIVETLRPYRKAWTEHLEKIGATAKAELEAYREQRGNEKI
jgi:PPK2 family polyphosphate:nucleotide phosphotransferase